MQLSLASGLRAGPRGVSAGDDACSALRTIAAEAQYIDQQMEVSYAFQEALPELLGAGRGVGDGA